LGLVRTDVTEEHVASIFRVERIREVATMLALTGRIPQGATFQEMPFFIVTAVKTSNLT
jgi:hypothetical protein